MGTKNSILLGISLLLSPLFSKGELARASLSDTANVSIIQWSLSGEIGSFEPAGWSTTDLPSLTRAQAVRMGLRIDEYVDERFDPVKGKKAAAAYYGEELNLEAAAFNFKSGTLLLADLADEANVPLRKLENANPHLRRDVLPAGVNLYETLVYLGEDQLAVLAESQLNYQKGLEAQYERRRKQILSFMPDPNTHELITYTVRSGDYLGKISTNTGAKVDDIRKWNRIRGNTIYAGQKLNVWVPKGKDVATTSVAVVAPKEEPAEKEEKVLASSQTEESDANFITYEVKPGDTLWGIANKFPGVSADNIKSWNKVDELIKAGEKLKIQTQTISDYSPDKYPSTL